VTEATPDVRVAIGVFVISSSSERGKTYNVKLYRDGTASCPCLGFTYNRDCRHARRARHLHDHPHESFAEDVVAMARGIGDGVAERAAAFDSIALAAQGVVDGIYQREHLIDDTTSEPAHSTPESRW
jgi:hypothetical protein